MFPEAFSDKHKQNSFPFIKILGTPDKSALKGWCQRTRGMAVEPQGVVSEGKEPAAAAGGAGAPGENQKDIVWEGFPAPERLPTLTIPRSNTGAGSSPVYKGREIASWKSNKPHEHSGYSIISSYWLFSSFPDTARETKQKSIWCYSHHTPTMLGCFWNTWHHGLCFFTLLLLWVGLKM